MSVLTIGPVAVPQLTHRRLRGLQHDCTRGICSRLFMRSNRLGFELENRMGLCSEKKGWKSARDEPYLSLCSCASRIRCRCVCIYVMQRNKAGCQASTRSVPPLMSRAVS